MNCDAPRAMGDGLAFRTDEAFEPAGIALFAIDAMAVEAGLKSTLIELLEDQGHETLHNADLTRSRAPLVADELHISDPVTVVLAIDLLPMEADAEKRGFDNLKIPKAIERARYLVRELVPQAVEPLVATRTSSEAWSLVRLLFPRQEPQLRARAERMRLDFATGDAIRDLTREGRRARVELVELNGKQAIRKTYRPAALRYMEREIEVLEKLSPHRPELPKLLDRGSNHIIISYIENGRDLPLEVHGGHARPLPLKIVRALADFIKACVKAGFDPIDLRAPGNLMWTSEGLKIIDFELWRTCAPAMPAEAAKCLTGVRADDTERPRGVPAFGKSYADGWYPFTRLSLESFLHDPAWLQQLKRGANLLRDGAARVSRAGKRRIAARLRRRARGNPRFIPARLGVSGLLAELRRRNVRFVVLRWFDRLPDLPPGGDLDLLVHDDDVDEVDRVLDSKGGIAECDVYSVSGLSGTAYSGVPHLPPGRAADLLASARLFDGICPAPTSDDYFLSLAFHTVYHKGFKSGLPSRYAPPAHTPPPKNDYAGTLGRLAAALGLDVEITLEGLDKTLARSGWQPTPEMLAALSRRNAWIPARFGILPRQ